MEFKTFLWIEDQKGKSSYVFWKCFLSQLYPDIIIESKENNSELVKSVKNLIDANNRYIIVFDNAFDNLQVTMEKKLLKQYARERKNIILLDIICFEYILLEFKELIEWIYAPDDEFIQKRAKAVSARRELIQCIQCGDMDYKKIKEVLEYDQYIENHNIEQLSAKLLFDLTRNTGFEVSKGNIGECWIKSCCEWKNRMDDDICGLDYSRLSILEKMKKIYSETCLKKEFEKIGLEMTL